MQFLLGSCAGDSASRSNLSGTKRFSRDVWNVSWTAPSSVGIWSLYANPFAFFSRTLRGPINFGDSFLFLPGSSARFAVDRKTSSPNSNWSSLLLLLTLSAFLVLASSMELFASLVASLISVMNLSVFWFSALSSLWSMSLTESGSCPYSKKNGEMFVVSLTWLLYANSIVLVNICSSPIQCIQQNNVAFLV